VREFIEQRIRWASKNAALPQKSIYWIWIGIWVVFTINIIALISSAFYSIIGVSIAMSLIGLILIAEYLILRRVAPYYRQDQLLDGYFRSGLIHYGYVILMGLIAPLRKHFRWKGRRLL
jgi:hypothetical protein